MSTPAKRPTYLLRVGMAHKRLIISAAIAIFAMVVLPASLTVVTRMLIGWDLGVMIYLAAVAVMMSQCSSVAAAVASLGAIFAELATIEHAGPRYGLDTMLAIATVMLS